MIDCPAGVASRRPARRLEEHRPRRAEAKDVVRAASEAVRLSVAKDDSGGISSRARRADPREGSKTGNLEIVISENLASRRTDTSAEDLVGPPGRMVSNAGQQQWYEGDGHPRVFWRKWFIRE
jgi:hypothetical protein